ncbi:MAG: low specificity L-threonine aldolase, partial [Clostridiales bacterium]|nr:low specificity L-threonine aldolase [Clostridiales bacterium]
VCNMFHVYFDASKETIESIFTNIVLKHDIVLAANIRSIDDLSCLSELSFGDNFSLIPPELLNEAFNQFDLELKNSRIE